MGIGGVWIQTGIFYLVHHIGSVGEELILDAVELVADDEGLEFHAELVGQLTALGEQFQAHIRHLAFIVFAIDDYVVLVCDFILIVHYIVFAVGMYVM